MVSEIQPGSNYKSQGHNGKIKLRLHHDVAHIVPQTHNPAKYQPPKPYGFQDTRFQISSSPRQGQGQI